MRPKPIKPKSGQESVWDYPRPPRLESFQGTIEVYFNDVRIALTNHAFRVLETSHPPTYYIPPDDINMEHLMPSSRSTYCEWKGRGSYYHIRAGGKQADDAAWYYSEPYERFSSIRNYVAFYAHKMQRCIVNGEDAEPQPGNFYGGWVTSNIVGPFKGIDGSFGW